MRFAAEELATLFRIQSTRIGFNAGLQGKAHLVAVTEIFNAAKTPAGAEFLGVGHGERVGIGNACDVGVGVHVAHAGIKEPVNLNLRGSACGAHQSARHGERQKSLFHLKTSFFCFAAAKSAFNRRTWRCCV